MIAKKRVWLGVITLSIALILAGVAYGALGDRTLSQGSRGPEVTELQKRLASLGYVVGKVDGIYGTKTKAAVTRFQRERGLKVDGMAGAQTIKELKLMTGNSTNASGKSVGPKNVDVQLLARCVSAEARGEPYVGQVAVAAVLLNRLEDPAFPNTIADIIYQPLAFSSVADGQINMAPTSSAVKAAQEAVSGVDPTGGAIYFFNPAKTKNKFIWSRPQIMQIGNHMFTR
ncbi:spore cortex-lytic enzyme [Desulfitobacterium dichloroeliminans LMG P-21439]|uniref:Spore cortex-lytic enzyme n=1 Tax=Desulfitobacterium dichloroeliminans (strain LMG P-21439 / DCA1) TaxID=871963 RepID=L0FD29_DESDL|nr:spore cortex-lytic enzyme [Desulfitobacterium dichloroeliminans]AGA70858.1 spore cortex-lytic enzyme [Desulfitobacterium dichloroeliminans LMG P-21439]